MHHSRSWALAPRQLLKVEVTGPVSFVLCLVLCILYPGTSLQVYKALQKVQIVDIFSRYRGSLTMHFAEVGEGNESAV